jgi:hypothetical protein
MRRSISEYHHLFLAEHQVSRGTVVGVVVLNVINVIVITNTISFSVNVIIPPQQGQLMLSSHRTASGEPKNT